MPVNCLIFELNTTWNGVWRIERACNWVTYRDSHWNDIVLIWLNKNVLANYLVGFPIYLSGSEGFVDVSATEPSALNLKYIERQSNFIKSKNPGNMDHYITLLETLQYKYKYNYTSVSYFPNVP